MYGEQRGAAVADIDEDGRVDLALGQNSAGTRLFRNAGAKPGLRVQLAGEEGNPKAIGAVVRLKYGQGYGPAREIHAGSGYWSQDSATVVLGMAEPPSALWVRWPGGKVTETEIPQGAKEVAVESGG